MGRKRPISPGGKGKGNQNRHPADDSEGSQIPNPPVPSEGDVHAENAYQSLANVAGIFGKIDQHYYDHLLNELARVDSILGNFESYLKTRIVSSYTQPVATLAKARSMVQDRIRYALATAQGFIAQTPIGLIHSQEDKYKKEDYYNAFITQRLPLHGVGDPPGETVDMVQAQLGPVTPSPSQFLSVNPLDAPTPTPTPVYIPTPVQNVPGSQNPCNVTRVRDHTPPPCPGCAIPRMNTHVNNAGQTVVDQSAVDFSSYLWTDGNGLWGTAGAVWFVPTDWRQTADGPYPQKPAPTCVQTDVDLIPPSPGSIPNAPGYNGGASPSPDPTPTPVDPSSAGTDDSGGSDGGAGTGGSGSGPGSPGGPPGPGTGTGGSSDGTSGGTGNGSGKPDFGWDPSKPIVDPGNGGGRGLTDLPLIPGQTTPPAGWNGDPNAPWIDGVPPWSQPGPTPTPSPTPTPDKPYTPTEPTPTDPGTPGIGTSVLICDGRDRWHSCWREIGGKQGSDREVYVSSGWEGRTDDAKGDWKPIEFKDDVQLGNFVVVNDQLVLPGVCDIGWQYSLIGNLDLLQEMLDTSNAGFADQWKAISSEDTAANRLKTKILGPFGFIVNGTMAWLKRMQDAAIQKLKAGDNCVDNAVSTESALGWMGMWTRGGHRKIKDIITQRNDFNCPTGIPSIGDAVVAYLSGTIDECMLEAYIKANNVKYDLMKPVVEAGRWKFSALELQALKMRDGFDRGSLPSRLREIGVMDDSVAVELETLSNQLPGPADLIRFMTRDAADAGIVNRFGLDDEFDDKWAGKLIEWAKNQGLTEEVAKYHWRSHWTIPSPTQLYDMYHKLRLKDDGAAFPDLLEDIKTAMAQQDILPFWQDRLLETAFLPMTRTDAKRAYNEGQIQEYDLNMVFVKNGYNDEDAGRLVDFAKTERREYIRGRTPVSLYAQCVIGMDEMKEQMQTLGFQGESMDIVTEVAGVERSNFRRKKIATDVVAGYKTYKLTYDDAMKVLADNGLDDDNGVLALNDARSVRDTKSKHLSMSQLCTMLDQNTINAGQYLQEAKDAGWSDEDAGRYLTTCSNKVEARKAKQQLAEKAKAEKAAKALQAESDKLDKEAAQQAKIVQSQLEKIERAREQRDKLIAKATADYAAKGGIDVATATGQMVAAYNQLTIQMGVPAEEAAAFLSYIAANWGKYGDETIGSVAAKIAGANLKTE